MSTIVLELVSDEIHRRRHILIRKVQESDSSVNKARWMVDFESTSKDLETLSLVHKSWTPIAQRCLGRILVLSDVDTRTATAATSASIFGSWTREVYLSSTNTTTFGAELWTALEGLFARTAVQSLCFEVTKPDITLAICNNLLPNLLAKLTHLRVLRLYVHPGATSYEGPQYSPPEIHNYIALFESLDRLSELGCLALRGCVRELKVLAETTAEFVSLERTRIIADLIRTISTAPIGAPTQTWYAINVADYILFHFNHEQERFVTKALHINDLGHMDTVDAEYSFFRYTAWFKEMEALTLSGSCTSLALLFGPFPRLTSLKAHLAVCRPPFMQGDIKNILSALPPTLEVLQIKFRFLSSSSRCNRCSLLADDLDEMDRMLAAIPDLCPRLRSLDVDIQQLLRFFRVKLVPVMPLPHLIAACEKRGLLLTLGGSSHLTLKEAT